MIISILRTIVLFILCIVSTSYLYAQSSTIAAEIPHETQVTAGGAFTYTLPLRIPPGIKEVLPSVAITYNSQGGNGILGMGWSITGLSAISRSGKNLYNDKDITAIDFSTNDALYLDGQRLYEVSSGEYLTHVKNFAKINSYGTSGNGPEYFIVEYPNGLVYKYGSNTNSRMIASNSTNSDVLTWSVTEIEDKNGNIITFTYDNNQSIGDYRVKEIGYATNTNVTGHNPAKIIFNYTSRNDKNKTWVNGSFVRSDYILDDITITHPDGSTANKYELTYTYDHLAHLTKIEEFRDGNSSYALPPVNINWGSSTTGVTSAVASPTSTDKHYTTGDFNGDGYTDYVTTPLSNTSSGIWELHLNDKSNDFTNTANGSLITNWGSAQYVMRGNHNYRNSQDMVMDYNGDGYDDLISFNIGKIGSISQFSLDVYLSNGATNPGFAAGINLAFTQSSILNYTDYVSVLPGDFDGDKKMDLLIIAPLTWNTSTNTPNNYEVFIVGEEYNNYTTNNNAFVGTLGFPHKNLFTGDLNGDGKTELWRIMDNNANPSFLVYDINISYDATTGKPSLTNQNGTDYNVIYSGNYPTSNTKCFPGDFNGDGKTDILGWTSTVTNGNTGVWTISHSTGEGFDGTTLPSPLSTYLNVNGSFNHAYYVSDFNGDGLDDIIQGIANTSSSGTNFDIFYSKGDAVFTHQTSYVPWAYTTSTHQRSYKIGDCNGDGQSDIAFLPAAIGSYTPKMMFLDAEYDHHQVSSIEHADKTYTINYEYLTKDADYTPAATSAYPKITRTLPVKVVKALSDNFTLANTYKYKGLIHDVHRRTMLGFTNFETENIDGQLILTEQYEYFANQLPYLAEKGMLDDPNQALSGTHSGVSTVYSVTEYNGGASGNSIIITTEERTLNTLDGIHTYQSINTGSTAPGSIFYEFGQPESTTTLYSGNVIAGDNTFTTTYTYDVNAAFHNKSKPISVNETDVINGAASYTRTTEHTYDAQTGLLTSTKKDPNTSNEHTISYTYNSFGNVLTKTRSASALPTITEVTKTYTSDGRFLLSNTNALGYTNSFRYVGTMTNSWGNVHIATDEKDLITIYEYDKVNRLTKTIYDNTHTNSSVPNVTENITYDWASNHTTHDPTGANARFCTISSTNGISGNSIIYYDHYNRKVRTTTPSFDGSETIYTDTRYFDNGQVEYVTSPYPSTNVSLAHKTLYQYDYWNREVSRENTGTGVLVNTTYDLIHGTSGFHSEKTIMNTSTGQNKIYTYSNGLLYEVDDNGNNITYTYNSNGSLNSIDANSFPTTYQYDAYGRVKLVDEPNSNAREYQYDAYGRVVYEKTIKGIEYSYTYDNLNRVLTKAGINTSIGYTYAYDNTPNIGSTGELTVKAVSGGKNITYTYDDFGRLIELKDKISSSNIYYSYYTYDEYDRVSKTIYPTGDEIQNNYNSYGNLEDIELVYTNNPSITTQKLWKAKQRNHLGQLTEAEYYDASNTPIYNIDRSYTSIGLPDTREVTNLTGSGLIVSQGYGFNNVNGNLLSRANNINGNTELFTYDNDFERLTRVDYNVTSNPGKSPLLMDYGNEGNILSKDDIITNNPNPPQWQYDEYAVRKIPDDDPPTPAFPFSSLQQDITYTDFNKVHTITELGGNNITFTYGPENTRTSVTYQDLSVPSVITTELTKYYSNNYEANVEHVSGDSRELCYIWAGDELVAIIEHGYPFGSPSTGNIYYVHTDHLGSVTEVLDNTGLGGGSFNGILEERSFDAWGRPRDPGTFAPYTNSVPPGWMFDRGYTGHEHIWLYTGSAQYDNGIINMNGRLYDPLVGRMLSPDPVLADNTSSQAFNRYTYANNNPLKYTDPDGNVAAAAVVGYMVVAGILNVGMNANRIDNFGDAAKHFGIGAGMSLVTYGVGSMIGPAATSLTLNAVATEVGRAAVHGGLGVARAAIEGGDLGQGFIMGFIGSGTSSLYGFVMPGISQSVAGSILFSTASGGFTSMAMGGSFWQGAFYSSIPAIMNHALHQEGDGDDKKKEQAVKNALKQGSLGYLNEGIKAYDNDVHRMYHGGNPNAGMTKGMIRGATAFRAFLNIAGRYLNITTALRHYSEYQAYLKAGDYDNARLTQAKIIVDVLLITKNLSGWGLVGSLAYGVLDDMGYLNFK